MKIRDDSASFWPLPPLRAGEVAVRAARPRWVARDNNQRWMLAVGCWLQDGHILDEGLV